MISMCNELFCRLSSWHPVIHLLLAISRFGSKTNICITVLLPFIQITCWIACIAPMWSMISCLTDRSRWPQKLYAKEAAVRPFNGSNGHPIYHIFHCVFIYIPHWQSNNRPSFDYVFWFFHRLHSSEVQETNRPCALDMEYKFLYPIGP